RPEAVGITTTCGRACTARRGRTARSGRGDPRSSRASSRAGRRPERSIDSLVGRRPGIGGSGMLRETPISIAPLMGGGLIAAIGFGALRNSSEAWAGVMLLLTCGAILLAVAGALGRGPGERAWWLGFVLFGGGYLALAHAMASAPSTLPTITLAEAIGLQL